jgi:hypothetical protein
LRQADTRTGIKKPAGITGEILVDERRSSKRWRTVLRGQIVSNNQSSPIEFTVRDLSDTGARIYFTDGAELPPEFKLEIPSRGLQIESRLMWRRGANHGFMFLEKVRVWTDPLRAAAAKVSGLGRWP